MLDAGRLPRCCGQRFAHLANQLLVRFVHANHGPQRIIRAGIDFQDIFYAGHKGCVGLRLDPPVLPEVRLQFAFFSVR